ncbi:MAG: LLM class flavin-dependent oxidoreductase, partial [Gammaproteobacteria bacterium]
MKFGFFFWPYDIALVSAMADAADRFGYDMVGIADTPGNAMDPWVAATLAASRTRRARVALCVTNLVTRHPAVTAASIASVDLVARGRTVLGIGVGHSGTRNLGAPSLASSELADGVGFIKTLLRGEPASYRGATAHLPWVKAPSPVFLAASHPRSLRSAGAAADGVFINFGLSPENVTESQETVVQAA